MLHISAVIYLLIAAGSLIAFLFIISSGNVMANEDLLAGAIITPILFFISFVIGVFVEIVVKGLKNNKSWAWWAALIICAIYIPSLFVVLGIIGLIGLVDDDVKKGFLKS